MLANIRLSQMWCVGGIVVLLAIVPWGPKTLGVPTERIREMVAVSIGLNLYVWGMRAPRHRIAAVAGDVHQAQRAQAALNVAGAAMCITGFVSVIWLTSILATTLDGAHLMELPWGAHELYPSSFNIALAGPLGLAAL